MTTQETTEATATTANTGTADAMITDHNKLMNRAGQLKKEGMSWHNVARQLHAEGYRTRSGLRVRPATTAAEYSKWNNGLRSGSKRTSIYSNYSARTATRAKTAATTVPVTFIRTVLLDTDLTDSTKVELLKKLTA